MIITLDIDSTFLYGRPEGYDLVSTLVKHSTVDPLSVFTIWGESFAWNITSNKWKTIFHSYPWEIDKNHQISFEKVDLLRAVNGVIFRKWHFDDLWFNARFSFPSLIFSNAKLKTPACPRTFSRA